MSALAHHHGERSSCLIAFWRDRFQEKLQGLLARLEKPFQQLQALSVSQVLSHRISVLLPSFSSSFTDSARPLGGCFRGDYSRGRFRDVGPGAAETGRGIGWLGADFAQGLERRGARAEQVVTFIALVLHCLAGLVNVERTQSIQCEGLLQ